MAKFNVNGVKLAEVYYGDTKISIRRWEDGTIEWNGIKEQICIDPIGDKELWRYAKELVGYVVICPGRREEHPSTIIHNERLAYDIAAIHNGRVFKERENAINYIGVTR